MYRGSEEWRQHAEEAQERFEVLVDARLPPAMRHPAVRYVEAEAGTGHRYVVVVSRLPRRHREGGPILVTVLWPWQDAWTMQETGTLHSTYVAEHLSDGRLQDLTLSGGDEMALTMTVAWALGRTAVLG